MFLSLSWPPNTILKESDVVKGFLTEIGFDANRVIYEERSQNTFQNGLFTYQLVRPKPGERWILVTQAISMARAVAVFRHIGWDVIAFPRGLSGSKSRPRIHLY